MEIKIRLLKERIEYIRDRLVNLINSRALTDIEVVDCSQQLDKLLTEYENTIKFYIPTDAA